MITRSLPVHAGGGGMERLTADLAGAWAAAGHDITCFTTPLPAGSDGGLPAGVAVIPLPGRPGRYSAAWREAVRSSVDPEDFDVVLGVSSGAASLLGRSTSTPIVMQAHGTALAELLSKLRTPRPRALAGAARNLLHLLEDWRDYPRYSAVVAVGPGVERDLRRVPSRFRPRRVEVIVNGVPPLAQPRERGGDRTGVAFVGRLRREKGPDLLIRALAGTTWSLTLAGDGPDRPKLEALARRLGVADRVTFLGAVDRERVAAVVACADAVVLPSRRREGLPLVLLETMALGRRVVVSPQIAASLAVPAAPGSVLRDLRPATIAATVDAVLASPAPVGGLPEVYRLATCARGYESLFERLRPARRPAGVPS